MSAVPVALGGGTPAVWNTRAQGGLTARRRCWLLANTPTACVGIEVARALNLRWEARCPATLQGRASADQSKRRNALRTLLTTSADMRCASMQASADTR